MRRKLNLAAVWDEDLRSLLISLGVLDDLTSGNACCVVCKRVLDIENLGTIIPSVDSVQLTCDNSGCVRAVTSQEALA